MEFFKIILENRETCNRFKNFPIYKWLICGGEMLKPTGLLLSPQFNDDSAIEEEKLDFPSQIKTDR
ncbi:hypothetical protein J1TS1_00710 [Shouchella clausii]|nr:hypothetical protein J1TS1_00710 [Shouchella clausii]